MNASEWLHISTRTNALPRTQEIKQCIFLPVMIVKIYSIAANLHLIRYDIGNDFQTYAQDYFILSFKYDVSHVSNPSKSL